MQTKCLKLKKVIKLAYSPRRVLAADICVVLILLFIICFQSFEAEWWKCWVLVHPQPLQLLTEGEVVGLQQLRDVLQPRLLVAGGEEEGRDILRRGPDMTPGHGGEHHCVRIRHHDVLRGEVPVDDTLQHVLSVSRGQDVPGVASPLFELQILLVESRNPPD